jgi:hypothetical protein
LCALNDDEACDGVNVEDLALIDPHRTVRKPDDQPVQNAGLADDLDDLAYVVVAEYSEPVATRKPVRGTKR